MNTPQRITCIRTIAQSLSNYEWADIDLILSQFKQPTTDSWSGDRKSYVIRHIEKAADKILLEMSKYLTGGTTETNIDSIEDEIWAPDRFKLFFSHITDDKLFVTDIKEKLAAYGIDCFVAHQDINPTLEWQDVIENALQSCDALTAFLTKNFHKSIWTDQEIGFCVARRVLILPIKIDTNPYGFIGKYQALNCTGFNSSQVAEAIFNILIESPLTSAKLSEAIVNNFVQSSSWESAKAKSLLLKKITTWTPELLRSIENGLETNGQISSAFGVPERIRNILAENSQ